MLPKNHDDFCFTASQLCCEAVKGLLIISYAVCVLTDFVSQLEYNCFFDPPQKQQAMSFLFQNCKNENTYKMKRFMNILLQLKKIIKLGFFRVQQRIPVFSYPRFCVFHYSSRVSMDHSNLIYFAKKRQEVFHSEAVMTQGGKNLPTLPISYQLCFHSEAVMTGGHQNRQRHSFLPKNEIRHYAPVRDLSMKTLVSDIQICKNSKSSRELSLTDKFISFLTIHGKKSKAHATFFIALKLCYNKLVTTKYIKDITESPIKILQQAVENIKPSVEIRKVRIAASTYQVPSTTPKKRQETLAIRWIIMSAQKTKENTKYPFAECLAQELVDAFLKQGQSRQRRDQLHGTAEMNRAFVRYKWW